MPEIYRTDVFDDWLRSLRDLQGRARIDVRIRRLANGNPGDVRPVGQGVSELRIDFGPGYRVYFAARGDDLILLLAGGDKSSQARDIASALALYEEWKAEDP
ncbi:MAG: type II toxin-antitoxin system RelE/ParE family toxin [Alphaproteobacteria bacterium]|nr:type II toxin-antitoxin system RelE/ParE family toxin [Alphaproteobacteria bacterium]